jgi:hypothetical protein
VIYAVYTQGFGAQDAPIEVAFEHISNSFDGHYFTGMHPPVGIAATPFVAVIDLSDMIVVDKETYNPPYSMSLDAIVAAVEAAATD